MAKYIIEGGVPLKGNIQVLGAKNSGFKLLIATLLSDRPSTISNIANSSNITWVSRAIEDLGGKIELIDKHTRFVSGNGLSEPELTNKNLVSRASSMFIPLLLHRFGRARVPIPSGDKIGKRPIDMHIRGLLAMGVDIKQSGGVIDAAVKGKLKGTNYKFEKNTHTGTETMILAACLAEGSTVLENAAAEPEVDDLIDLLNKMGAVIERTGQRTIGIKGVSSLSGAEHRVMPDRGEVVTFGCCALATKGDVTVFFGDRIDMKAFTKKVKESGGGFEDKDEGIRFFFKNPLKPTNVQTAAHPGFITDWQSLWATLMTQAVGSSIIHETVFENRFAYVESLKKMGANIEYFNPEVEDPENFYNFHWTSEAAGQKHAIKISGPTKLVGKNLPVSDIRAGATLVLAALAANGKTVLNDIEHIERGYEKLEERLGSLGAKIKKLS